MKPSRSSILNRAMMAQDAGIRMVAALVMLAALLSPCGCSRSYYRRQADREVNCIVDNKSVAVGTPPGEFRIDVDPRSRMFDPTNPDCPPMPPDDPTSHQLMNCVDCKPGSPCWRHSPKTPYTENPTWEEHLPRDEDGNVVLDLTGAVQMALLNSTDYQQQVEELYLSGLDVTFERFRFDTQFFGGSSIFFTADGRDRSGSGSSSSFLEVQPFRSGNRLRAEKLTATGGELVVGLANSLMWQFSGPDDYSSNTVLDFSIVQPLLRAAGRDRVLERLTISERALLANVRQMERYRRGFYLNVVTGRDTGAGPSRRGGFFGGSGLEGFTGVGGGGFGRVGGFVGQGFGGGGGFTGGAGAAGAGGYLGLLQTAQVIRNQQDTIARLRDNVAELEEKEEAVGLFQVDLARQALYTNQSQLLNSVVQYESSLDNFKVQYGLPPDLNVKISDPLLDRFNLVDPPLTRLQMQVVDLLNVLRGGADAGPAGDDQRPALIVPNLPPPAAAGDEAHAADLAELVDQARELTAASEHQFAVVEQDFHHLQGILPQRRSALERLAKREEVKRAEFDADLLSIELLDERAASLEQDLGALSQRLEAVWSRLDALTGGAALPPAELRPQLTSTLSQLSADLLELSLLQARARLDAITFEPVDLTSEEAYCIASRYRRDWMNARAALVDSWRLIQFNADELQSDLDIVFSGDIGNVGDNPFRLRSSRGRLRVGLEFDAPLTRLSERNTYRQSLIEYQQARRTYYEFCDRIKQQLRATLRQLQVDELNLELRRKAVRVAITQVDQAQERVRQPPRPEATSQPGQLLQPGGESQVSDTLARDLVDAHINLLNVQNDFLSVWVDHEVQRLNLDFDLGTMAIDPQGVRIEHGQPMRTFLASLPCDVPCELPNACEGVSTARAGELAPGEVPPIEFSPGTPPAHAKPMPTPADGATTAPRREPHSSEIVLTSAAMPGRDDADAADGAADQPLGLHVPVRLPPPAEAAR